MASLINKKGSTTLSSYTYTYYLDGNIALKHDSTSDTKEYTYDGVGRLKTESSQYGASITYTYDDSNNRATMTVGGVVTSYNYDKNNRLVAEIKNLNGIKETTRYYYDKNGNQISKAIETIASELGVM